MRILLLVKLLNPLMTLLLRSLLHGLVSRSIMLITVTGRKTGRTYTTPVSYWRAGDTITCFTDRANQWWRNLRAGAPVVVRVCGQDLPGTGEAISENRARIADALVDFLRAVPRDARFYGVELADDGQPDAAQAAQVVILVVIHLAPSEPAAADV